MIEGKKTNADKIRSMTDEEIIEAAKKHGTSLNGIRTIAKEFGYAGPSSIQERVRRLTRNE